MEQHKITIAVNEELLDKTHIEAFFLREATTADAELLYQWRNDAAVRRYAFHSGQINFAEHLHWLEKTLNDGAAHLFIMMHGMIPVGQIRVNRRDEEYVISYSIDKHFRGHAFGRYMLTLLAQWMKEEYDRGILSALVKKDNRASQRIFERLGYQCMEEDDFYRYTKKF
ncbi:GNAT family N-acetyltransferase [Selenomonas sp. F0473]|uniref:GNAT family N-acetyltransferase n=1 Tax=Selenomonas sp. F0473 TaxID=999423 RepID=UPI000307D2C4|nr:GNAT family N-acetyltransferase [Selenomonas sp. F0473]